MNQSKVTNCIVVHYEQVRGVVEK